VSSIHLKIFNIESEINKNPPTAVDYREWNKFAKWLCQIDIITVFDFE